MSNNKYRVLVVEDEKNIRSFMQTILEVNGYQVILAKNGEDAQMMSTSYCPDLMILDLGLPDMDGQSIIEFVRKWSNVPIIVVSARTSEKDKVTALDLGANDYVTKPFGTAELLARVRATLRNKYRTYSNDTVTGRKYTVGDLVIDYDKRRVYIGEREIDLTQTEYNILAYLSQYAGKVLTYDMIIHSIWGANEPGGVKKLQVNMANIRKKIGSKLGSVGYIYTEVGVGYRMLDEND